MRGCNVAVYEHLISLFKHCAAEMKPFADVRDGLGLEDRLADNMKVPNRVQSQGDVYPEVDGTHITNGGGDSNSANEFAAS